MSTQTKGLLVFIYSNRQEGDTGGPTADEDTAVLMVPGVEVFEPGGNCGIALYLYFFMGRIIAIPAVLPDKCHAGLVWPFKRRSQASVHDLHHLNGWSFGGNYVTTSDSRFPWDYPIPVYDNREHGHG